MGMQGIYRILNIVNGRCYIGSSIELKKRMRRHQLFLQAGTHWSKKLQRSWNKHGAENFKFECVEVVEDSNFLLPREQFWIWRTQAHLTGYNTLEVPDRLSGYKHSEETKAKMKASMVEARKRPWKKRPPLTEEQRAVLRTYRLGKKMSPEDVARIAKSHIGLKRTRESRDRISAGLKRAYAEGRGNTKGVTFTPEVRAAISAGLMGRTVTLEARANMSRAHLGKKWTDAQREKAIGRATRIHDVASKNAASAQMRAFWADDANRAARSERVRQGWARRRRLSE